MLAKNLIVEDTMRFQKRQHMNEKSKHAKNAPFEKNDKVTEEIKKDENVATPDATPEKAAVVEVNDEQLELLRAEVEEHKDKYVRLAAEFDNFRKRSRKEHYELEQTAGKDVIVSLLVVMDDMDRAAKQMETSDDINAIKEGVTLVFNKFRSIMQKRGLSVMEARNTEFNPDLHEAITEVPVPDSAMEGKVIDVIEPGYYLNDKLIRFAKVVLGRVSETQSL